MSKVTDFRPSVQDFDFQESFFHPSLTSRNNVFSMQNPDFSTMLTLNVNKNANFHSIYAKNFDLKTYFLHFFLSLLSISRECKTTRKAMGIQDIFWTFEPKPKQLKAVIFTNRNGKPKLVMKIINLDQDNILEKKSLYDDLRYILKHATFYDYNIEDYKDAAELHWYEIRSENLVSKENLVTSPFIMFTEAVDNLEMDEKFIDYVKQSKLVKAFRRIDKFFNTHYEYSDIVKNFGLDDDEHIEGSITKFMRNIIRNFKGLLPQELKSYHSSQSIEAHAGFTHGALVLFQKDLSIEPRVDQLQSTDGKPIQIILKRLFNGQWSKILNDLPVVIEFNPEVENVHDAGKELLVTDFSSEQVKSPIQLETISNKVLMGFPNFNADQMRISIREVQVAGSDRFLLQNMIDASLAVEDVQSAELMEQVEKYFNYKVRVILDAYRPVFGREKQYFLSRYLKGYLASNVIFKGLLFDLQLKNPTDLERTHMKSFLMKVSPELNVVINIHEKDPFTGTESEYLHSASRTRKYPTMESANGKTLVHDIYVSSSREFDPDLIEHPVFKKHQIHFTDTHIVSIDQSQESDFVVKEMLHLDLHADIQEYFENPTEDLMDGLKQKISSFFGDNTEFFNNGYEMEAFILGMLREHKIVKEFMPVKKNTLQIGFHKAKIDDDGKKMLMLNLAFEGPNDKDSYQLLDEMQSRSIGRDQENIKSLFISLSKNGEHLQADVLSETQMANFASCSRSARIVRSGSICEDFMARKRDKAVKVPEENRRMAFLNNLNRVSAGIMYGLMAKNLVADIIHGNMAGIAINTGFIFSSYLSGRFADKLLTRAFIEGDKLLLAGSLKAAAPFVRRAPSFIFVGLDLYNNIQAYKNNQTEAAVSLAADAGYIGLDFAETAIEVAEAFGIIEGVSSVTGPIGWSVGAALLLGADVYQTVKKVQRIDQVVHLSKVEKFTEGFRAFFGMDPSSHIAAIMKEKQKIGEIFQRQKKFLDNHANFNKYLMQTELEGGNDMENFTYTNLQYPLNFEISRAMSKFNNPAFNAVCYHPNNEGQTFWEYLASLFGLSRERNLSWNYVCYNTFGLQKKNFASKIPLAYIQLGYGHHYFFANTSDANVFDISGNNGVVHLTGGNVDDTFILRNMVFGRINGLQGENTLDMSNIDFNDTVYLRNRMLYSLGTITALSLKNINVIIGRQDAPDHVEAWCSLRHIELLGGARKQQLSSNDRIFIPQSNCTYNLTISISGGDTHIVNRALSGRTSYSISKINNSVLIKHSADSKQNLSFVIDYPIDAFSSLEVRELVYSRLVTMTLAQGVIMFQIPNKQDYEIKFRNNVVLHLTKNQVFVSIVTGQDMESFATALYGIVAQSTMPFIVHSILGNKTVTLHGRKDNTEVDILFTDSDANHHHHTGKQETVFILTGQSVANAAKLNIKNLTIDKMIDVKRIVVDVNQLEKQWKIINDGNRISLAFETFGKDIVMEVTLLDGKGSISAQCLVTFVNAMVNETYKSIVIQHKSPLSIEVTENNTLEAIPLPIYFSSNQSLIVLSPEDNLDYGTRIILNKLSSNFTVYKIDTGIIISNVESKYEDIYAILVNNFYTNDLMQSLIFEFIDLSVKFDNQVKTKDGIYLFKKLMIEQYFSES